jgi:hypothetical protein
MSPLTALFLGISAVLLTCIAAAAGVTLYGMRIVDCKADQVFGLADQTVEGIPDIIESVTEGMPELFKSLPPVFADAMHDRRAPEYAGHLAVTADLRPTGRQGRWSPVVTITNQGEELVSLLCIRVAALDANGSPRGEWTEVVATPLAIDHHWRGPLMPQATRHVVLRDWRGIDSEQAAGLRAVYEISELRVWNGQAQGADAPAETD